MPKKSSPRTTLQCPECFHTTVSDCCELIVYEYKTLVKGKLVNVQSFAHAHVVCPVCHKISALPDLYCSKYVDGVRYSYVHRFTFSNYDALVRGVKNVNELYKTT